jgi:hypothetical protein
MFKLSKKPAHLIMLPLTGQAVNLSNRYILVYPDKQRTV